MTSVLSPQRLYGRFEELSGGRIQKWYPLEQVSWKEIQGKVQHGKEGASESDAS